MSKAIVMLKNIEHSQDGVTIQEYFADEEYTVSDATADRLVELEAAEYSEEDSDAGDEDDSDGSGDPDSDAGSDGASSAGDDSTNDGDNE